MDIANVQNFRMMQLAVGIFINHHVVEEQSAKCFEAPKYSIVAGESSLFQKPHSAHR